MKMSRVSFASATFEPALDHSFHLRNLPVDAQSPGGAPVLNLLETGCLATSPSAALVKAPKLLWTDCGLAAWLAGIKSSADGTQRLDTCFGPEQMLFQTLDTWRALDLQRRKLHFWDLGGHEVDFIPAVR
jgi:hypothetical protein